MRNPDPRLYQLEQEAVNLRRDLAGTSIGVHRDLEGMIGALRLTAEYMRDTVRLLKISELRQQDTDRALSRLVEALGNPGKGSQRAGADLAWQAIHSGDKKKKARVARKRSKRKREANATRRADLLDESGSERSSQADHPKIKAV